ncbi:MAG: hypothetical protein EXR39_14425 [Betaproteobacteria bacterium]|nr:hypothetical protein [Betaproteobacteria bacterium]
MNPRGERIACMVETVDGARGVYSVFAGSEPQSIDRVDPVEWGPTKPIGPVKQAMFSVIAEMGMTEQIIRITGSEWTARCAIVRRPAFLQAIDGIGCRSG